MLDLPDDKSGVEKGESLLDDEFLETIIANGRLGLDLEGRMVWLDLDEVMLEMVTARSGGEKGGGLSQYVASGLRIFTLSPFFGVVVAFLCPSQLCLSLKKPILDRAWVERLSVA